MGYGYGRNDIKEDLTDWENIWEKKQVWKFSNIYRIQKIAELRRWESLKKN